MKMKAVVLFLVVLMCTLELTRFTLAEEFPAEDEDVDAFDGEPEGFERRDAQDFQNEDTEFLE